MKRPGRDQQRPRQHAHRIVGRWRSLCLALVALAGIGAPCLHARDLVSDYVESYFATYPTQATAAGRSDRDHELENLGPEQRKAWIDFQLSSAEQIRSLLADDLDPDDRLDLELLLRQVELERLRWTVLRSPERNPLFWTEIASRATVFLLVREDRPATERLEAACARVEELPRLVAQAEAALELCPDGELAPELARLASSQLDSLATFYRTGFAEIAREKSPSLFPRMSAAGEAAAEALAAWARSLNDRSQRAAGTPRTGDAYGALFELYTGLSKSPAEIEKLALEDLRAKREEAAAFGREVWAEMMGDSEVPDQDGRVLGLLFQRIEADRAPTVEAFVADYRELSSASIEFVSDRDLLTLPDPMPITIGTSPDYFMGQGVGGVYPPGPYAPGSPTLLFLPTPPSEATEREAAQLFAAFNHAFNTMITPHELVPGHTFQLASAARHDRKVRALFPDDVYVEGWGTFAERLMLDLGWGDVPARLAHLKKQMENIARLIVDIRVHTTNVSEQEVMRFVRDEALQDEQFAGNMWLRALTSSPQLTTYHLGYRQVMGLYEDVRDYRGEAFDLKTFLDGMMELGPVPVRVYRERMLAASSPTSTPRQEPNSAGSRSAIP